MEDLDSDSDSIPDQLGVFGQKISLLVQLQCRVSEKMAPQRQQGPTPGSYECDLTWKRVFGDMIKLRLLAWGEYPGCSGWAANAVTHLHVRDR